MIQKYCLLLVLAGVVSMSDTLLGQNRAVEKPQSNKPQSLSKPVGCGLMVKYIDEALAKAALYNSNIIFIIKMKNSKNHSLVRIRANNLKNYIRFRGFKDFEVAVDLDSNKIETVDIYVRGELLNSIPIEKGSKLSFSNC